MFMIRDVRVFKSHFAVVLINICVLRVSVDISVGKCVLLSAVLLMCPSIYFFRTLIDRLTELPSVNLCPLIGFSKSPLLNWSGNAYCCLFSY